MKHRIFNKGDVIHALVSAQSKPDIIFPVRAIIIDTKWDPANPKYLIKIQKFFDSLDFLKKHYLNTNFTRSLKGVCGILPLKKAEFIKRSDLEIRINQTDAKKFYIVVDSVMCVKSKRDLKDLFNRIQFYLISKRFKEIKEISTRSFFNGKMSLDSKQEFNIRFKNGWGSLFDNDDLDLDKYLHSLM